MTSSMGAPPPIPGRGPPRPPPKIVNRDDPPQAPWKKKQSGPPALPKTGGPPALPKKTKNSPSLPPAPNMTRAPDSANSNLKETMESDRYKTKMQEAKENNKSRFNLDGQEYKVPKDAFNAKNRKKEKRSQFGPMSRYMALNACACAAVTGMASMRLSAMGEDGKSKWGGGDALAGTYAFFLTFPLFYWEYYYEQSRKLETLYPLKAIIYFVLGIIPWISFPTQTLAIHLWLISFVNFLAWRAEEKYPGDPRRKKVPPVDVRKYLCCKVEEEEEQRKKKKVEHEEPFLTRMSNEWQTILRQGDGKMYGFVAFWLLLNFIVLCERWDHFYTFFADANEAQGDDAPPVMVPFWIGAAKGFGTVLDINMSAILLPVCRTFIRMLYNLSTGNRGTFAMCLRYIFSWMPLDKNLDFHKFCAAIVWVSAWLHTLAHMFNYAKSWRTYEDTWGAHIWFSGICLLVIIHIIYSSAFDNIRWGKFELFWYNHQLFVFFFGITLLHGEGGWNPNFWKYFLVPGTMYAIERGLREYRTRQNFGIVSVTHMESSQGEGGKVSKVFELELEKQGAMENFREGQYVFLKCPHISDYQWHPFTVASAPQASTFTCIIRNQGQGSWTDKVQEYLKLLGPPNATHYELTHREGNKLVPQYLGPDGTQLIQVDGPYAAPTQHCSEYNVAVIVGAGIGVTPLRATMQSIVHHRWPYTSGAAHPDHGHFHWMLRWSDLATFAFMMRTIKDVEDDWADQNAKNPTQCSKRGLEIHIWLSRVPKDVATKKFVPPGPLNKSSIPKKRNDMIAIDVKSQKTKLGKTVGRTTEMFGPAVDAAIATKEKNQDAVGIKFTKSGISEMDIYKACWAGKETKLGHITIHNGRPKWDMVFQDLSERFRNEHVGFMLCGPAAIADALKTKCGEYSAKSIEEGTVFRLHSENF